MYSLDRIVNVFHPQCLAVTIILNLYGHNILIRGRAGPRPPKRPSGQPKPYFGWPCWPAIILYKH